MILVHTHPSTVYKFSLHLYQYICVSVCVCLCVCLCVYCYRVLDFESSPKLWPFKTISVTTYTVASSLVFGRGIQVAYALHVSL